MLLLYTRTISYFFKEKIKGFEKVEKMLVLYLLICICTNTIYFINEYYSGSYSPSPLSPLPSPVLALAQLVLNLWTFVVKINIYNIFLGSTIIYYIHFLS